MRERARSAERPNEEQRDEWLDRLVRHFLAPRQNPPIREEHFPLPDGCIYVF